MNNTPGPERGEAEGLGCRTQGEYMHTTTPQVPLLHTAAEVADFLDGSYSQHTNGEALFRMVDHVGDIQAVRLWRAGVQLTLPQPQTAVCPTCRRLVAIRNGQYEAHTDPRGYDRPCHQGGH